MKINRANSNKWLLAPLVLLALMPLTAWAELTFSGRADSVPAEFWEQPRTGRVVLEQGALRQSVSAWLEKPDGKLLIHYGSGEESLLRAEELRAWLIALAVEAARIDLAGDLPGNDEVRIELITKRGQQ